MQGHGKSSRVLPRPPGLSHTRPSLLLSEASHLPSRATTALELWLPLHVLRNFFLSINLSFPFLRATSLGPQVDSDPFNLISFKKRKKRKKRDRKGRQMGIERRPPPAPVTARPDSGLTDFSKQCLLCLSNCPSLTPLSPPPTRFLCRVSGWHYLPSPHGRGLPCLVPHMPMCSFLAFLCHLP